MKFKKIIIFCLFSTLFSVFVQAQDVSINGKVIDENGVPVPGATILIKGTSKQATSSFDGNYQIKATPNDILVFSFVGYSKVEESIKGRNHIDVKLMSQLQDLKEVVVVGYGTQQRKNLTNAVSSVKSDAFDNRPIYSVAQAMQGNAAGVNVIQPSGKPGVSLEVRIRGLSSLNSGNSPLYVIDGVQTNSTDGLNTNDIVDMQILKDATATAIYGVNGSAGVVLITTKKGKANTNAFSFNSYFGTSKIVNNIDVLNLDQYKTLMSEINPDFVATANQPQYAGINTDWRDKVFQTGQDQNYDFSYSGGTDKIRTFASLAYLNTKGIVKPADFRRFSARLNLDIDAASWLKAHVGINAISSKLKNTTDNTATARGGVILSALNTAPFLPVYGQDLAVRTPDPDGIYPDGEKDGQFALNPYQSSWENPVAFQSKQDDTNAIRYLANVGFDVKLAENLVWKPAATLDLTKSTNDQFIDAYRTSYGRSQIGSGSENVEEIQNSNFENTLNYTKKSGNNDINILVGSSLQKFRHDNKYVTGKEFPVDLRKFDYSQMKDLDANASDTTAYEKNAVSFFGRGTYIYKEKYIVNGVLRASGASQLAAGNKWGYFPGVSAAWIVSNEDFLKSNKTINELKLRGGWGQSGNISGIGPYSQYSLADSRNNIVQRENTELTWETSTDLDFGLDAGFIDNRVRFTVDVFDKKTTNLIQNITFPSLPGSAYVYNGGKISNRGLELVLNTINFNGDFKWNTNFNITFIKNKVLEMGLNKIESYATLSNSEAAIRLTEGYELGTFYGYLVDKVNPTNGLIEYKDINGDGMLSPDDRTVIGHAMPTATMGFTNTFSYKGLFLDVLMTSSQGNDIFNATRLELEGMQDFKNQSTAVLNRWTTPGQITDVPKANDPNSLYNSNRWVEDGSYIRLKSVTLGYDFNKMMLGLKSLKLYFTGQNLITWTNYSGFDPEVSAYNTNTGTSPGIDYGTYPQVRTFIFGLKAGF
ncbi:MAG TPA: TonB-dependent receptor [Flavobacterium sp.]|uniref:SusC/RagA family TonB-linked outer membrane protein n=1 Tax=Flavobacterium sp. TaxID=239 RepID=UPI002DBF68BE|nr:TonB-dependent receptor [Flavobacterium sp.]HEU4790756.1 TonB-dependent receptor [Flavobacterium sp.]